MPHESVNLGAPTGTSASFDYCRDDDAHGDLEQCANDTATIEQDGLGDTLVVHSWMSSVCVCEDIESVRVRTRGFLGWPRTTPRSMRYQHELGGA